MGSGRRRSIVVPVGRLCIHKWFSLKRFETFFKSEESVFLYLHTIAILGYLKNPVKFQNQKPQMKFNEPSHLSELALWHPTRQRHLNRCSFILVGHRGRNTVCALLVHLARTLPLTRRFGPLTMLLSRLALYLCLEHWQSLTAMRCNDRKTNGRLRSCTRHSTLRL